MPISSEFRKSALVNLIHPDDKEVKPESISDSDLYWQTVCDLGAYLRLKLLDHFNPNLSGAINPESLDFPKVCVTLGSGLDAFGDSLSEPLILPYKNLPGLEFMSLGHVPGHKKCIIAGRQSDGTPVVALSGRIHAYERSGNVDESALLTAAILDAGVNDLILTNAAGSLDRMYTPGMIMLGTSIMKETVSNFGTGLHHPYAGDLFYPAHVLCTKFHNVIKNLAEELGVITFQGSYVQYPGRRYEFPGEIARLAVQRMNMLQTEFAHLAPGAVGMSTGHEVECACQHATREEYKGPDAKPLPRVVVLSTITNLGAGLSDIPPNHKEVEIEGKKLSPKLVKILENLVGWMSQ